MNRLVVDLITVPLFTGVIGYVTNWTGVLMLFRPVAFHGVRVPGLKTVFPFLPRRVQLIPAIVDGRLGWQGIIPSRAAKMASIAVDKGIAKLGSPAEFYEQLDPEQIAAHILASAREEIRDVVERIMRREHPRLWADLPQVVRETVHGRVQQQLPAIVREVTDQIGAHIDQLLDIKLMVIRRIEERPELANRIFLDIGRKELRFMQNFGFYFGFPMGIPLAFITWGFPGQWWILPIGGVLIGYATNYLGLAMIFQPVRPRRVGRLTLHGLFMRRQPEVAQVYGRLIADDLVNLKNIGEELLTGPRADKMRSLLDRSLRPAVDKAVGPAKPLARAVMGSASYEQIRRSVATEAAGVAVAPLGDEEFNRRQSARIFELISARLRSLSPDDFAELLRSGIRQDEWLLLLHGAVLGFAAGLLHLAIFG